MPIPRAVVLAACLTSACLPLPVLAIDGASLDVGDGTAVKMIRVGLQSQWDRRWFASNGTHVSLYWDATLAQWRGSAYQGVAGRRQELTDLGLTPMLRLRADNGLGWYLEGGIGLHLLSALYDNDHDKLSTHYQFGDEIGAGYVFSNGWEAGARLSHFSNGGLKEPNSGVNFLMLRVKKSF